MLVNLPQDFSCTTDVQKHDKKPGVRVRHQCQHCSKVFLILAFSLKLLFKIVFYSSQSYSSESILKDHEQTVHENEKDFYCQHCDQVIFLLN